ncbi:hypothetical protein HRH36_00035 [Enterococcus faecalis]|nr:hypothetical protein [Enterococcus faecalis]NSV20960.1 hypothetical protein [Enterococcus faecalis]NSV31073.1 hypothetical protein [Enterococcus faecalis]NSV40688.1 hypothetical protein [Enterococcus faecalis]NSV49460.1 hypothetical protein [Enterococcus faecalis]
MNKDQISQIKSIAEEQLENLTADDCGADWYLKQIIEFANVLLNDGY